MASMYITPVKNVLRTINSCQTVLQLQKCKTVVKDYVKDAKNKGIVNINELQSRLNEELIQREETLYLSDMFNC